ncbi:hypothetical protein [Rhodohalobacter sp. 8-1]|uniref:hypothetical protein n=1 Tax=Rhodohalobacter sp. 8-1 TaxID=3131972 RepID=UPI0030EB75B5
MKALKILFSIILFTLLQNTVLAQDRLIKVDGDMLQVVITKIRDQDVKYKLYENPDGPLFTNKISMIHKIILETGDEFYFSPLISKQKSSHRGSNSSTSENNDEVMEQENFKNQGMYTTPTDSNQFEDDENFKLNKLHWTERTSIDYSMLNTDLNNIQTDPEIGLVSLMMEIITYNTFTMMGEFNANNAYLNHHGIVTNISVRSNSFAFEEQILVDLGIGYGIQYNSLTLYSALNTSVYFWQKLDFGDESEKNSVFFPSNAEYFKLGLHWKPFLKKRLVNHNDRRAFGIHASLNSYNGGNSFMIGLSF